MCPLKIHMLKANPQCDGVRTWCLWGCEGYEGGVVLLNGISVLPKETPRGLPGPSAVGRPSEKTQAVYELETGSQQMTNLRAP